MWLAPHASIITLAYAVAMMVFLPSLAAILIPEASAGHKPGMELFAEMLRDIKVMFTSKTSLAGFGILLCPLGAAAAANLFSGIAVSGILVDILKVIVGRPRPKLLFSAGSYEFSWIGLNADHWSFPSGHAATAAALMAALWCLWPQPVLFYAVGAALIAPALAPGLFFCAIVSGCPIAS